MRWTPSRTGLALCPQMDGPCLISTDEMDPCPVSTDGWSLSCIHRWIDLVLCPQLGGYLPILFVSSVVLGDWRLLLGVPRSLDDGRQAVTVVEIVRSTPPPSVLSCLPPLSPTLVTPPPIPPLPLLSLYLLFLLLLLLLLLLSTVPSPSTVTSLDSSPRSPLVLEARARYWTTESLSRHWMKENVLRYWMAENSVEVMNSMFMPTYEQRAVLVTPTISLMLRRCGVT